MICRVSSLVGATIKHYNKGYQYNQYNIVYILLVLLHVLLEVEPKCALMLGEHTTITVSIIWNRMVNTMQLTASVFPDPVCAMPTISSPDNTIGQH